MTKWFDVGSEAVGVVAVGQVATGVIAIGQAATGVFAIGQFARGVFVIGQFAFGVLTIGQFAAALAFAGGMFGVAGRRWFGWLLELVPTRPGQRALGRLALFALVVAAFWFFVAQPLWDGAFAVGGFFNQPLR